MKASYDGQTHLGLAIFEMGEQRQRSSVFVEKDGQVRIEIRGVKGTSCLDLTKDLEAVLGDRVTERELTPEADETAQAIVQEQQWQWGG